MSSNLGHIPLLTKELAALERLKNQCCHFFVAIDDQINLKFVCKKDMYNNSIISSMSSNLIRPPTMELTAFEHLKIPT